MSKDYLPSPSHRGKQTPNPDNPMPEEMKNRPGQTVNLTISLYPRDAQLITALTEFLGCSRSEAVRTAIRHMATHLRETK